LDEEWVARVILVLVSFFLGFCANLWRQVFFEGRAYISKNYDVLCETIRECGDLGTEYWVTDASKTTERTMVRGMEAKISGFSSVIMSNFDIISKFDHGFEKNVGAKRDDFFNVLTGGDFEGAKRKSDFTRAKDTQVSMAEFLKAVRRCRANRFSFPYYWQKAKCDFLRYWRKAKCFSQSIFCKFQKSRFYQFFDR